MTLSVVTHFKPCLLVYFLSTCFCISQPGGMVAHSCAKVLPKFILWTSRANLLAFFHQPGDTVLVVFRAASPRATTHLHRRNAKSPCQLDMTHATPHTHHSDNPVIINTNLSASARGPKVLWREGESERGEREGKADTLSTGHDTISVALGSGSKCECECAHRTVRQGEG